MHRDRSLRRRTYLALAGSGLGALAGCTGGEESDAGLTTTTPGQRETTTERDGGDADETAEPTTESNRTDTADGDDGTDDEMDDELSAAEESLADLTFEGSWFDTHAHWLMADSFGYDDYTVDDLTAIQHQHDVGATVLFCLPDPFAGSYDETVETLARHEVDYLPFFFPGIGSREVIASFYRDREAVLYGAGEVTYYSGRERGTSFTESPTRDYFEFTNAEGLPLMLHPTEQQADEIGSMLSQYPDTKLLLHGHELAGMGDVLPNLLREHDNLYWTHDVATMTGGIMVRSSGKADFVNRLESRRSTYLDQTLSVLPTLLEAAPDRVMWGTDVVADWHVDPDVYGRMMDFSHDVLQALPANHRDPYAFENAEALFDG